MPAGYRMEWAGEFGPLVEAKKRLAVIVPLSLLLILMLLYSLFNSCARQFYLRFPASRSPWPAACSACTSPD